MKKVSIIIPHLPGTRQEFLKQCLRSIEEQDYPNIELLLIEQHKSEVDNIKDGLKVAKGDIIHIMHDDDWFTADAVSYGVEYLHDYDFIHGNAHEIGGRDYVPTVRYPTLKDLANVNTIHNVTIFYRKELFEQVGEYEQDWLFSLKCLEKGMRLGYCPNFLKNYRLHPGSLSNSSIWREQMRPELVKIVRERYGDLIV